MNQGMNEPVRLLKKISRSMAYVFCAFLVSYLAAVFLNTTSYAWHLVERAPKTIVEPVGRVLLIVFWPLLPEGVHEQEEMLELLLVWVFSGLAFVPFFVLLVIVWLGARRSSHYQT